MCASSMFPLRASGTNTLSSNALPDIYERETENSEPGGPRMERQWLAVGRSGHYAGDEAKLRVVMAISWQLLAAPKRR
jgi:hypothetical protein